MTQATGSNVNIKLAFEETENELKNSGNYINIPFKTGESLTVSASTYQSELISKNRGVVAVRNGSYTVGGSLQTELSFDNFALFAHLALGKFEESGGVKTFKRNKKVPTFSLEKGFTDINEFYLFNGCKVNSLQLQTQTNGLVHISLDVKGNKFNQNNTTFLTTLTEKSLKNELITDLEAEIEIGGLKVCASSLNLNISNDLVESRCIGSPFAKTQAEGKGSVSGDVSFAFENGSIYQKWKNETTEKLVITYKKDENNYIKITLPTVKWGGDGISKVDSADALFLNMSFTSLVDEASASDIIVEVKSELDYTNLIA